MKINHKFAPFTIEIDSQKDKDFLCRIANLALDSLYQKNHKYFSRNYLEDAEMQEINYFLKQIRGN